MLLLLSVLRPAYLTVKVKRWHCPLLPPQRVVVMETHINLRSSPERLLISASFQYRVRYLILGSRRCKRRFPIAAILGSVPGSITAKSPAFFPKRYEHLNTQSRGFYKIFCRKLEQDPRLCEVIYGVTSPGQMTSVCLVQPTKNVFINCKWNTI